jgi:dTDP-4-dehydrorhamnose reductase
MRLLITGSSGQLGGYVLRELAADARVAAWSGTRSGELFGHQLFPIDLANPDQVARAFAIARPDAILHLAAMSMVSHCFADPLQAEKINLHGTRQLAELAAGHSARLVYVSTDMVFDGRAGYYRETDTAHPLMIYGRTKLAAEEHVLAAPKGAVARVSLMFGPTIVGRPYFFDRQLAQMRAGEETTWFEDEFRSIFSLLAAARALLGLVRSDFTGMIHVGGPQRLSRFEFGQQLAAFFGAPPEKVRPVAQASIVTPEPRPRDVSLDSSLWHRLFPGHWRPHLREALQAMVM